YSPSSSHPRAPPSLTAPNKKPPGQATNRASILSSSNTPGICHSSPAVLLSSFPFFPRHSKTARQSVAAPPALFCPHRSVLPPRHARGGSAATSTQALFQRLQERN